jgi:phage host-nuclease inhibitor protein Gam
MSTELDTLDAEELAPEGQGRAWTPPDIRAVEWCLEQIGQAEAERAEIRAQMDAACAVIEKRGTSIIDKSERRAEWFLSLVETYAKTHRDEFVRGKLKSRELLGGTVGFRSSGEKVAVTDPGSVIAWAQEKHLDLLDLKPKIDKKALDRFVLTTGEIPPGVDVTPATETIHIKTNPLPQLDTKHQEKLP